jgi:hypothetical protein
MTCLNTKNSGFMALKFINWRSTSTRTEISPIPHADRIISRTAISTKNILIKFEKKKYSGYAELSLLIVPS